MTRSIFITLGIVTCAICVTILWTVVTTQHESAEQVTQIPDSDKADTTVRSSITFILGEDKEEKNRYYEEAALYYTGNTRGKTDFVITNCRSLTSVKDYLKNNKPAGNVPWGVINLVSHGNQWTGLSVKVSPDSKRATVDQINAHMESESFQLLPADIVDSKTEIFLHGCGVGKNRVLVDAVRKLMRSENAEPVVHAPTLFEYYASVREGDSVLSEHYMARTWFVSYPMGERPADNVLINALRDKYQYVAVNWYDCLQKQEPRWIGDTYHYTFEVPVKLVLPATDSLPDLTIAKNQVEWLSAQKQITDALASLEIPMNNFKWSFTNVYADAADGSKIPAVYVKGYCTILCVLEVLTDDQDQRSILRKPYIPGTHDQEFYYTSSQQPAARTKQLAVIN